MKKRCFLLLILSLLAADIAFAEDIVISLQFPKKNIKKLQSVKAIPQKKTLSGTVLLDISPYPAYTEKDKCFIKYYIDEIMVYKTDGWNDANPGALSFSYALDTTKYANGEYRLYVNYFDRDGNEAIGSARIVINNKN